jgi:hypothetical protein
VRGVSDAFAFVLEMFVVLGASFYTFFKKRALRDYAWLWNECGIVAKMGNHRHLIANIPVFSIIWLRAALFQNILKAVFLF